MCELCHLSGFKDLLNTIQVCQVTIFEIWCIFDLWHMWIVVS